jgi:cytochrome c-type protein NapB
MSVGRERLMRMTIPFCVLIALAGCAQAPETETPSEAGIPDAQIGLSKESVLEVPSPEEVAFETAGPGEKPVVPRAYEGSPPVIPHAIDDLLPITRENNSCLDCHVVEEKLEGEPTPIPRSHYIDLRNAPSKVRETVAGARYKCTTCHAAQTGAAPLVKNRFLSGTAGDPKAPA